MNRTEMIEFIIFAHQQGVTKKQIYPKGKGSTFTRVTKKSKNSSRITDKKILELYNNAKKTLKETPKYNQPKETPKKHQKDTPKNGKETLNIQKKEKNVSETASQKHQKDTPKIIQLQQEISSIKQVYQVLEERLNKLEKSLNKSKYTPKVAKDKAPKIMGFNIRLQSKTSNGKKYKKWYASKGIKIDGKRKVINIYLGDSCNQARKKIEMYLKKYRHIAEILNL